MVRTLCCLIPAVGMLTASGAPLEPAGKMAFEAIPGARLQCRGPVGQRVDGNLNQWLLTAPQANPGMLEMFRTRDRQPAPQLVPWAGEFVGKYLISGVQSLRLSDDPRLEAQILDVVNGFIATQAEDGYLGPFPRDIRLLKNWDLWGHYHAIQALLMWYERTGDPAALAAARKAADLLCRTFLDSGRRVFDAGDAEMNMAILTGMAMMHRITGEPRYLRMALEVEKDWERAGDYLRAGLDGREFFQSPRPRWESLHDLQGLVELYRITGDPKYREAFVHHWRSIRRWDRRNTGGFSSGEQATGNPYAATAIETCCTVAWMAVTIDYLKLTGDPRAADELELSMFNGGLGAQHPSGRWWTYNTPMDGVREASAHTIVFQARAGTPELNCCSVNGPRVLGMLSEWALMTGPDGLVLNSYLPGACVVPGSGGQVRLELDADYPRVETQRVRVAEGGEGEWTLRLRIPAWSLQTRVEASFPGVGGQPPPGSYLAIRRRWKPGDSVTLKFDFGLRAVAGAAEAAGKVSLYRGPILLAWDQAASDFDATSIPRVNLTRLASAQATIPSGMEAGPVGFTPWLSVAIPAERGLTLRLVDFASAGSRGTPYRSWLAALNPPAPPAFTLYPRDGERVPPGSVRFAWRGARGAPELAYRLEIATNASFTGDLITTNCSAATRVELTLAAGPGVSGTDRWWRVVSAGPHGETIPDVPPARLRLDPAASAQRLPPVTRPGPKGELVAHSLRGEAAPAYGRLGAVRCESREGQGTRVNGRDQMVTYALDGWPEGDFSVAVRVRIDELPARRIGQVFSAWATGMDDPLRLTVENGRLFARIEAGQGYGTAGVPVTAGAWLNVAAVKEGTTLRLYVDGREAGKCSAPEFLTTSSQECALGGNPRFGGNEFLAATFADFGLWARALTQDEVRELHAARK